MKAVLITLMAIAFTGCLGDPRASDRGLTWPTPSSVEADGYLRDYLEQAAIHGKRIPKSWLGQGSYTYYNNPKEAVLGVCTRASRLENGKPTYEGWWDISINRAFPLNENQTRSLWAHEHGHCLSYYGHRSNEKSIMNPYMVQESKLIGRFTEMWYELFNPGQFSGSRETISHEGEVITRTLDCKGTDCWETVEIQILYVEGRE